MYHKNGYHLVSSITKFYSIGTITNNKISNSFKKEITNKLFTY